MLPTCLLRKQPIGGATAVMPATESCSGSLFYFRPIWVACGHPAIYIPQPAGTDFLHPWSAYIGVLCVSHNGLRIY